MNLAIVDWFGYNLTPQDRMIFIKEAGFSGVLLLWADYFDNDFKLFPDYARKVGLNIENAHAPYLNANDLWKNNINGQDYLQKIIDCVEDCANYGVPTLVLHLENKKGNEKVELPENYCVGVERLKKIIDIAEKNNINIAVENMSRYEFLDCVFENIQSKRLGFCFDSGHCNLFTPNLDLLTLYGNKLMALHLHDNDNIEDLHLLPFTGKINWSEIALKLNKISFNGAIALEVGNTKFEHIKEPKEYLKFAVKSAEKIYKTKMEYGHTSHNKR